MRLTIALLVGVLCLPALTWVLRGCEAFGESVEPPGYVVLPGAYDSPDYANRAPRAASAACTCAGAAGALPASTMSAPIHQPTPGVR